VFWVISVYFNIRNTLAKSGTFLLGHPVYIYIYLVLLRVKEQRNILHEIRKRKAKRIGYILPRSCLLQQVIEGKIKGDRSDRETRKKP